MEARANLKKVNGPVLESFLCKAIHGKNLGQDVVVSLQAEVKWCSSATNWALNQVRFKAEGNTKHSGK